MMLMDSLGLWVAILQFHDFLSDVLLPRVYVECGWKGLEPPKAEPTGLQPVPFDHFGTDPREVL